MRLFRVEVWAPCLVLATVILLVVHETQRTSTEIVVREGGAGDWRYLTVRVDFSEISTETRTVSGRALVETGFTGPDNVTASIFLVGDDGIVIGGSVGTIDFPATPGGRRALVEFWSEVEAVRSRFWYPFDAYALFARPDGAADENGRWLLQRVNPMTIGVSIPGIVARQVTDPAHAVVIDSGFGIVLERPVTLRIMAVVVVGLALAWLVWVMRAPQTVAITQLIGFFVGVWTWRALLGPSGFASPLLIDYVFLLVSVLATASIVFGLARSGPLETQCRFCFGPNDARATKCRHCASDIPHETRGQSRIDQGVP